MAARTSKETHLAWAKRLDELVAEGYAPPGSRVGAGEINATTVLARELGIGVRLMRTHIARMISRGYYVLPEAPKPATSIRKVAGGQRPQAEIKPIDRHNSDFWRKRALKLQRDLGQAEHLAEELAGIRKVPFEIPDWLMEMDTASRGKSVIGCLVSDVHMGEVISADELLGLNAFNPEICTQRMERYFGAVCTIGQRWASDTDCEGVLLALDGDLISGDIHEELRITNALTSHEQCLAVSEVLSWGIVQLRDTYGRVHVVVTPGNHGRNHPGKSTAKLYSRLSYDMLIGAMIAEKFKDDPRVTFQMSAAKDQITPVFGRTVFTTHGDKIGTKGGMGFAGPMLPIVRGTKKIEAQQAGVGRRPDLIQIGHYHTTGNPGHILANGSVPGYSEYGDDLRAVVEPPQQWAYLLHSKWWLRERMPIQLEDPNLPEKPRVTVPAGWQVAA